MMGDFQIDSPVAQAEADKVQHDRAKYDEAQEAMNNEVFDDPEGAETRTDRKLELLAEEEAHHRVYPATGGPGPKDSEKGDVSLGECIAGDGPVYADEAFHTGTYEDPGDVDEETGPAIRTGVYHQSCYAAHIAEVNRNAGNPAYTEPEPEETGVRYEPAEVGSVPVPSEQPRPQEGGPVPESLVDTEPAPIAPDTEDVTERLADGSVYDTTGEPPDQAVAETNDSEAIPEEG